MIFDSIVVDDNSSVLTPPRVTSAVRYPSVSLGKKCQLCSRSQTSRSSRGAYWRKGRLLHGSAFTSSPARQVFAPSSAITPQCATKGRTNSSRAIPITPSKTSNARHRFFWAAMTMSRVSRCSKSRWRPFRPTDSHWIGTSFTARAATATATIRDWQNKHGDLMANFLGRELVKQLAKHQDQEIV